MWNPMWFPQGSKCCKFYLWRLFYRQCGLMGIRVAFFLAPENPIFLHPKHLFRSLKISCLSLWAGSPRHSEKLPADVGKWQSNLPPSVHIPHKPASSHTKNATGWPNDVSKDVQSWNIYDSQMLKILYMTLSSRMGKWALVYSYSRAPFTVRRHRPQGHTSHGWIS